MAIALFNPCRPCCDPPPGCLWEIVCSLSWEGVADYSLYVRDYDTGAVCWTGNPSVGGLSLNHDAGSGCDPGAPAPPETISGVFDAPKRFLVWYNHPSTCAPERSEPPTLEVTIRNIGTEFLHGTMSVPPGMTRSILGIPASSDCFYGSGKVNAGYGNGPLPGYLPTRDWYRPTGFVNGQYVLSDPTPWGPLTHNLEIGCGNDSRSCDLCPESQQNIHVTVAGMTGHMGELWNGTHVLSRVNVPVQNGVQTRFFKQFHYGFNRYSQIALDCIGFPYSPSCNQAHIEFCYDCGVLFEMVNIRRFFMQIHPTPVTPLDMTVEEYGWTFRFTD